MAVENETSHLTAHARATELAESVNDRNQERQDENCDLDQLEIALSFDDLTVPLGGTDPDKYADHEVAYQVPRDALFFLCEWVPHHEDQVETQASVETYREA